MVCKPILVFSFDFGQAEQLCDFRELATFQENKRGKLVWRISEIPEIQMEKETSKFIRYTSSMNKNKKNTSNTSQEEDCLVLMDKLTVKEQVVDITNQMENLTINTRVEEKDDIRANYTLLLERMAQVGAGAARAGTRRDWVRAEEERMKRDREAQWLARVRGVGLVHKGRFFG